MRIELTFYIAALSIMVAVGWLNLRALDQRVVGRTPEGFHRLDAEELMQALCEMNPGLICPDAYALPNYLEQMEGSNGP